MTKLTKEKFNKRKYRVRVSVKSKADGKPRLSVFRSGRHIYAQIIDDSKGSTIVSASTLEQEVKKKLKKTSNIEAAEIVGGLVAEKAIKAGVSGVVFDRGGYLYHGKVKALADAARAKGLIF